MAAEYQSTFDCEEWQIDGAIISTEIQLVVDYALDHEGPFFRRLTGAYFKTTDGSRHGFGPHVPDWLFAGLTEWCRLNEDQINEKLAVSEAA